MTVILKPVNGGRPIVIDKPILLVGRHPDCDIILKDNPKISRKHCCLALVDNRFVVRDLESMNGVWIDGDRVEHSGEVKVGGELVIGDVGFHLVNTGQPEDSPPLKRKEPKVRDGDGQTADVEALTGKEKVEFSSAFAVPVTDSSQDDDFIPLADMDE